MKWREIIKNALLGVSPNVWHFEAATEAKTKNDPYIVWAEDGAGDSVFANGRKKEGVVAGTVDLFTKNLDGEPLAEAIPKALDGVCAWRLLSAQHEEDTGILHYEWAWEIEDGEVHS